VRGIGTWTANYVMMRGCAFPDCVPAGDSALSASLREYFALDHHVDANETRALMERFAPWRSLATYHFWLR
jgi:3-methyladenine DNA glycosylase/8-oxoguanine DNA glycosylase